MAERSRVAASSSCAEPRLRIFTEARLQRVSQGAIHAVDYSSGAAAWDGYVERIGAVELAARVGSNDGSTGVPVGRIQIRAMPFYSGPRQLMMRLPSVLRAVRAATSGTTFCLFRLPGTVSLMGAGWCRMRGRRYAVEIVGDPAGVLRSGVLGRGGRFLATASAGLMRYAVAGAAAGRFVTTSTLQALYPLAPGVAEHCYSNVSLAAADFTAGPRTQARPVRRLIAVGTHDQLYKGHDDLIRAVALLADRKIDVHLGLVGDGRYHDLLRDLARASGVGDRVTFYGRINSRAGLQRLLDESDLFCMPSRTEGLPRALIEAMARGLPAVGTLAGGIPELIDRRYCAPPSDPEALATLITSFTDGTIDVGQASRAVWERAQQFTPCRQQERIDSWLEEIARLVRTGP